jgi:hypothetical protein
MSTFLLLSADEELYGTLRDKFLFTKGLHLAWVRHNVMRPDRNLVHDASVIIDGYEDISSMVTRSSGNDIRTLRRCIGIVDLRGHAFHGLQHLSPLSSTDSSWVIIVSMLVLAFPELHWMFLGSDAPSDVGAAFAKMHLYPDLTDLTSDRLGADFVPLFDAAGLRTLVRQELRAPTVDDNDALAYVPVRCKTAASIDDEQLFAYFNAHAAYRFGYRCYVVTNYGTLKSLFGSAKSSEHISLTFEDLSLNFADKPAGKHLFLLDSRDQEFPVFTTVDMRVFVTVGAGDEVEQQRLNDLYVRYQNDKTATQKMKTVYKPLSGFFDLWKQATSGSGEKGQCWSIPVSESAGGNHEGLGLQALALPPAVPHGVPGRMLLVVGSLIERAESILERGSSVQDYIHGAVLAIDALELTGNRTPTMAIEALALKHQLELLAECKFYGLRSNLEVLDRLDELHSEIDNIGCRFQPDTRRAAQLETEINIIGQLVHILRDHGRFDEEQICMSRLRARRRSLWLAKKGRLKPLFSLFWPVRWYTETLIHSPGYFLVAVTGWLIAATVFFYVTTFDDPANHLTTANQIGEAFFHAVENFVSAHPPDSVHELLDAYHHHNNHLLFIANLWISPILMMLGFFHVGILIAYLYSVIVRRAG